MSTFKFSPVKQTRDIVDVNNEKISNREILQERLQAELDLAVQNRDLLKEMYEVSQNRVKELEAQLVQNTNRISALNDDSKKLYSETFSEDQKMNNTEAISGAGEKRTKSTRKNAKSVKSKQRSTARSIKKKKHY